MEAPVRIENRAQMLYLLTEAAELEHGIMCCYLFTAASEMIFLNNRAACSTFPAS